MKVCFTEDMTTTTTTRKRYAPICQMCGTDENADECEYLYGDMLLCRVTLCEACEEGFDPPEPTAFQRRLAWT